MLKKNYSTTIVGIGIDIYDIIFSTDNITAKYCLSDIRKSAGF
jgi:hypothetical protein